jgi:hypothetical protein
MNKPWWKGHKIIWLIITVFFVIVVAMSLNNIGFFNQRQDLVTASLSNNPTTGETQGNPRYVSNFGFSFNYPTGTFVWSNPDQDQLVIMPNSYKDNQNEPVTGVVISAMLNQSQMTPLEWLKGPDSGYDISKGYSKLDIDGQEAISIEGGTWIVLNTPDDARQLSIATLPGSGDGALLLLPEMNTIVDSLVFTGSQQNLPAGTIQYAPPSEENKALCSSISFSKPTADEIKYNTEISNDEFVQYLRRSINDFLDNNYVTSTCSYTGLLNGTHCADFAYEESNDHGSALFSESADVLSGKFIVLETDLAPGGGESIVLMFKNKPDEIFYAWVYDYTNSGSAATGTVNGYDLRELDQYTSDPGSDTPTISETQHAYIDQLCSSKMGI